MSVYQPPVFTARDAAATGQVIRDYPFAALITARAPEPQISHLPLLFHPEPQPAGELIGHMARANPHWRQFADGPTMAVFQGPHEYISPSWYAEPETAVPTWNYAVVHVHGRIDLVEGRDETLEILNELVDRFESSRPVPWRLQLKGKQLEAMVGAIVAFRMVIERTDTKLKLSQNRSAIDRQRVVDGLRAENTEIASATADWMKRYAGEPEPRVRLDKWLFAARFYKTRSVAAQAVEAGRVRVDDQRVKPSQVIRPGARITLRKDALTWEVEVAAVSDKRGPASEAATLYRESPQTLAARLEEIARRKAVSASAPRTPGRPTKRDRRKLLSFLEKR